MRINAELLDLRAFLAVMDFRNFHRAAESLNMSQPALSRRVQALEVALGIPLFERTTRRVTPSRVGIEIEATVRRVLQELEDCAFAVGEAGGRHQGQLTIAAVPTASAVLVPKVVSRFLERYPDIHFRILDLTAKDALQAVLSGEAELGVNFLGSSQAELKFTPIINDEFVLVCRRDHKFARLAEVSWRDLTGERLIVSQRSDNRALVDQALASSKLQLNWSVQVGHLATSFGLVEAGAGMSVVPRLSTPDDGHPILAVIPLKEPRIRRTIGLLERRSGRLSNAAERFKEILLIAASETKAVRRKPRLPKSARVKK